MQTSRRMFVLWASLISPVLISNPLGFFRSLFAPKGEVRPVKHPPPNPFVREGKTLVGVVKGRDVDRMVRECVALIGGVEKLDVRGKTVLVKPNVVADDPPPTTTNPEVVAGVVRLLYDAGARHVVVGDMSGVMRLPTRKNLERTGIERAAREAGAEVIDFDDAEWIEVKPTQVRLVRSLHVAKPVYEADVLVNVPVVKTHAYATYSICLKNLVGVTHPRYRPYRVNPAKWEEVVAEMNLAAHPVLNIVDATRCMIAGGPVGGTAATTDVIIASGDRVAADAVGLGLIKSFGKWSGVTDIGVWDQRQIRRAQELGLGIADRTAVELVTRSLEGRDEAFAKLGAQLRGFLEAS